MRDLAPSISFALNEPTLLLCPSTFGVTGSDIILLPNAKNELPFSFKPMILMLFSATYSLFNPST
jgi:hypothetical protein